MNYEASNFWIFRNGAPYRNNDYLLNPVGRYVASVINYLYTSKKLPFAEKLDYIIVTSQYRKIGRHATNKAIDITAYPLYMIPILWIVLHQYTPLNVILSLHDRHIHIDYVNDKQPTQGGNFKGLEIIAPARTEEGYLQFYFRRPATEYIAQIKQLYTIEVNKDIENFFYKYYNEYRSTSNKLSTNVSTASIYYDTAKQTAKETAQEIVDKGKTLFYLIPLGIAGYFIIKELLHNESNKRKQRDTGTDDNRY